MVVTYVLNTQCPLQLELIIIAILQYSHDSRKSSIQQHFINIHHVQINANINESECQHITTMNEMYSFNS